MRPTEIDWNVEQSTLIVDNHSEFISDCELINQKFKQQFPNNSTTLDQKGDTSGYSLYNVFTATSPNPRWHSLFQELISIIRDYVNHDNPLWMQSWINFQQHGDTLDWHSHSFPYHGYISIDPKDTTTVFEGYKIPNEVGNIYIGPGERAHTVQVNEPYEGERITLGFDVTDKPDDIPFKGWSFIPIL